MYRLEVTDNTMASVLILNRSLEEYPEPYRGNNDITLSVSFGEYLKFIDRYLEITDYLSTSTLLLKSKLELDDRAFLVRSFYQDVACAIAKELFFSRAEGEVTRIIHTVDGGTVFDDDLLEVYKASYMPELVRAKNSLVERAKSAGFMYSPAALQRNRDMWFYASLLYGMASHNDLYGIGYFEWSRR